MKLFKSKEEQSENLLVLARNEAILMLELGQEMFHIVTEAITGESLPELVEEISKMDKNLNKIHRRARRKIFEHLSFSGTRDLFSSLVVLSVVNDAERIGDYNKNIGEVVELLPRSLNLKPYDKSVNDIWKGTMDYFTKTLDAFRDDDLQVAAQILKEYDQISNQCDGLIREIIKGDDKDSIRKDFVALVLLLRYFKRVNAHLKNVASTIINPFHRIGYRPKKKHLRSIDQNDDE